MPLYKFSRFTFCTAFNDTLGPEKYAKILQLSERDPFTFRSLADNVVHSVVEGENLWNIAERYYSAVNGALPTLAGVMYISGAQLWWIIADFQPDPIIDPTIALVPGQNIILPSVRTVMDQIFNENRRNAATV